MYLSHFGLAEQPFSHSSTTEYFYEGANRGATLDALIYILTHGEGKEGIIQVSGSAGSGKTRLCRSLMRRLPGQIRTIYLALPTLSPEEFLRSIADELNSDIAERRATAARAVPIDEVQHALAAEYDAGSRVVILVDEAHTMPVETFEAALTLYELESSRHKLLQIVLFAQTELENRLALPQMRKLKDRVSHHFILQPLNARAAEEYLMCRIRAAGYRGSGIFSPEAVRLLASASGGLIPQLDILADKSMVAASVAQACEIKASHVKTASEGSGIELHHHWGSWRERLGLLNHRGAKASVILPTVVAGVLGTLGWLALRSPPVEVTSFVASKPIEVNTTVPVSVSMPASTYPANIAEMAPSISSSISERAPAATALPESVAPVPASTQGNPARVEQQNAKSNIAGVKLAEYALLEQRVEETRKIIASTDAGFFTVQLFTTNNVQPDRMERFLTRARGLIDLSNLYVHPVKDGDQAKFRVTYGIYSSRDEATTALAGLPSKYQNDFQLELYTLSELR